MQRRLLLVLIAGIGLFIPVFSSAADPLDGLSQADSPAALEKVLAGITDEKTRQALQGHAGAIVAAAQRRPHVAHVKSVLEAARGAFEPFDATPPELKAALGRSPAVFASLRLVSLADAGLGVKEKRITDPFDREFYEHVGQLDNLEELLIMHTVAENAWLAPLAKLKNLKALRIINQAKLGDEGLALLAPLSQLEAFSYIGTQTTAEPFSAFGTWSKVTRSSYRGSRITDAGLAALCQACPNLETLVLAHGHYTDAGAAPLAKLSRLTGLEIGSPKATAECLRHIVKHKLEYLQIGGELNHPASIAILKDIPTLKRLSLTGCKTLSADDLKTVAGLKPLESLELGNLENLDERETELAQFRQLKTLRVTRPRPPIGDEQKARIQALLPGVAVAFQ